MYHNFNYLDLSEINKFLGKTVQIPYDLSAKAVKFVALLNQYSYEALPAYLFVVSILCSDTQISTYPKRRLRFY